MEGVDTRLYLGVNPETGKATHLDIAVDPGLCVIAPVGAGKSFLAGSLLGQALAKGWEGFVFDPTTGDSFQVSMTGLVILKSLRDGKSDAETAQALAKKYEVDHETAARDIADFRAQLKTIGLA